ncbi:MAG: hypothetical protein ACRDRJ_37305 [Streptosporangiaceae bacterium]
MGDRLGPADARRALDEASQHLDQADRADDEATRRAAYQEAAMRAAWAGRLLSELGAQEPVTGPAT